MVGRRLADMKLPLVHSNGVAEIAVHDFYSVKSPVFPFNKFRGWIPFSALKCARRVRLWHFHFLRTGLRESAACRGTEMPSSGTVFISVNDRDKRHLGTIGKELVSLGFKIVATRGTASALHATGVPCEEVYKVNEGRPNIVDLIKTSKVHLVINTPLGRESFYDEKSIRRAAIATIFLHHHAFSGPRRRYAASTRSSNSSGKFPACRTFTAAVSPLG